MTPRSTPVRPGGSGGSGVVAAVLAAVAAVASLVAAPGASAQSVLNAGGLGSPVEAQDARSLALGGVELGLFGPSILPNDPSAAADLTVPGVTFTIQPTWVDVDSEAGSTDGSGTRFPVIGAAYPVGGFGMATLTAGGVFDQRWDVLQEQTLVFEGNEARVTDQFVSDGGISAVRLGFARRLSPSLALGVSAGTYVGDVTRSFTRRFDSLAFESEVPPFQIGGRWRWSGALLTGGAQVDISDVVRLSGSVTWSGTLKAEPTDETDGAGADFDVPLMWRAGASGVLAPDLTAAVGVSYADWSSVENAAGGGGSAALDVGGGLEWDRPRIFGRTAPFRVGYRRTDLPFRFDGEEASESAFTGGVGINLVQAEDIPLARVDAGVERGERTAGTLTETFWKASLTLRVSGF